MNRGIERNVRPDYLYNGGVLWLRADASDRAPPYLQRLTRPPSPRADWFAALAHAWTRSNVPAKASAMERAAPSSESPNTPTCPARRGHGSSRPMRP